MKLTVLFLVMSFVGYGQTAKTTPVSDLKVADRTAADRKAADPQPKLEAAVARPGAVRIAPTASNAGTNATNTGSVPATSAKYEYYTNVVIPAGQTVNLDSSLDYSSSDTIRVTVRSTNTDLLALLGTSYFAVPNATEFVTQEAFLGSDFFYSNSGGATFQVCGPQFRLTLGNTGTTTMTLSSVLIYTHVF